MRVYVPGGGRGCRAGCDHPGAFGESAAPWAVVQLQDMLSLGDEARLNVPGTPEGNWRWRVDAALLTDEVAARYRTLAKETGR